MESDETSNDCKSGTAMHGRHFGGRATAALDRAVHVALPADARVLAGEKEAPRRPRQPGAQRRIECGIEVRVAAARPGVGFPDDLRRGDKLLLARSEPVERGCEGL